MVRAVMASEPKTSRNSTPVNLDELRQAIQSRTARRVRGLDLRIDGATLMVSGTCSSYHVLQLAVEAIRGTAGRMPIANELRVSN